MADAKQIGRAVGKVVRKGVDQAMATADPMTAALRTNPSEKQKPGAGTGSEGLLGVVADAQDQGKKAAADALAAQAPADTYGAMLRELARARTQSQMRATNGRAGSILGIGTDSYTAPTPAGDTTNDRVSADKLQGTLRPVGSNRPDNYRVPAYARLSRLGLFSNVSRGMR